MSSQSVERDAVELARIREDLFLVQRLDAWGTTLRARARKQPKVHLVDSGLAARLLGLSSARVVGVDPTSLTEFGHLLETFVISELRKQASWLDAPTTLGHWRTDAGDEVDLVIESDDGSVVAFEVKANQTVPGPDFKGLRNLRDALGERFVAGVALSLGSRSYTYEERLHVCPVDRLWSTVQADRLVVFVSGCRTRRLLQALRCHVPDRPVRRDDTHPQPGTAAQGRAPRCHDASRSGRVRCRHES